MNVRKEFIFVLRKPDGSEYELPVTARTVEEAERRLKNALDALDSRDKVIGMIDPRTEKDDVL